MWTPIRPTSNAPAHLLTDSGDGSDDESVFTVSYPRILLYSIWHLTFIYRQKVTGAFTPNPQLLVVSSADALERRSPETTTVESGDASEMATNVGPHLNPNPRCLPHPHLDNLTSHLQTYKHHNPPPRAARTLSSRPPSRPHIVAHPYASSKVGLSSCMSTATHRFRYDIDELQQPAERRATLCSVVLDSQRESRRYQDALVDVLSSEREQKALYALRDSTIKRMLNILHLVSIVQIFHLAHPCSLVTCDTFDQRSHA